MTPRLPESVVDALNETRLPWEPKFGTKHIKIFLANELVGVCSKNGARSEHHRANLNIIANIKRKHRAMTQRQQQQVKGA